MVLGNLIGSQCFSVFPSSAVDKVSFKCCITTEGQNIARHSNGRGMRDAAQCTLLSCKQSLVRKWQVIKGRCVPERDAVDKQLIICMVYTGQLLIG
jgi:hypothetical protein